MITEPTGGSSPRMRGTPVALLPPLVPMGIIPAYAGNTQANPHSHRYGRDHPRVCGEHPQRIMNDFHCLGSSPRMRGTPHERATLRREQGIIPAYAGNTGNVVARGFEKLDHPRVCGEHQCINRVHLLTGGSSPRMRGTPKASAWAPAAVGIIPAYAGNTSKWPG